MIVVITPNPCVDKNLLLKRTAGKRGELGEESHNR